MKKSLIANTISTLFLSFKLADIFKWVARFDNRMCC